MCYNDIYEVICWVDSEYVYCKEKESGKIVKFDYYLIRAYYLDTDNHCWIYSSSLTAKLLHMKDGVQFEMVSKFDDQYQIKEIYNYKYFKLNSGLILKIDADRSVCYRLGTDNMWHLDPSSLVEFEYGELNGEYIQFEDIYLTGDIYRDKYHNRHF